MKEAEHFLTVQNWLGEGSFWNADEQQLYWVDIHEKCFYHMDIATRTFARVDVGVKIGVMAFCESGGLVMATNQGFMHWDMQEQKLRNIANPLEGQEQRRFNDGNIDAKGRFWAGTMCDPHSVCQAPEGKLYRLDPDGSVHLMETGIDLSNGLVWSLDNTTMYLTDSTQQVIYAYDFDLESGAISNRRPFIQTSQEPGVPDGLTIDEEGYLWSARCTGYQMIRYSPEGKVVQRLSFPVPNVTSCTFAGPDLDELCITTAWENLSEEQRKQFPQSGDLFRCKVGVKGTVRRKFAL
jgi:sugar lactone lactonase YvrE